MTTTSSTAATSATASIVKTLGSGSGIDVGALVTGLVEAQFAAKTAQLNAQADAITAQISSVAQLKSGITSFDAALKTLIKGGTLATQPTSSNPAVAGAAAIGGAKIGSLSGQLVVARLASAQAATTNAPVDRTAAFRTGTLSVTMNGVASSIAIDPADATLAGIAAKINAAKLGLTASVVSDGGGVRLTVKGPSGAANAFTISGGDADPTAPGLSLDTLSVGPDATGTTIGMTAGDAAFTLDGAEYHRAGNDIADLVPGVRLTLAGVGTTVLGASRPTVALGQAVNDFVASFNEIHGVLMTAMDPVNGPLKSDPAARTMRQALGQLSTTKLIAGPDTEPRMLADIGVKTNRDGTLSVDATRLAAALARYPEAVEALFAEGTGANAGLSGALGAIAARVTDRTTGFDGETERYSRVQSRLTDAQAKAADDAARMKERLTQQFAAMDSKVAAYKSTGAFLKQQVDAWYAAR